MHQGQFKILIIVIIISLIGCKTTSNLYNNCELINIPTGYSKDGSHFFLAHYNEFIISKEPGIFWFEWNSSSTIITRITLHASEIEGQIIRENGTVEMLAFSMNEFQKYKSLLSNIPKGSYLQQCKPLSTDITNTFFYIKDQESEKVNIYFNQSPFDLDEKSRLSLGNIYPLIKLVYHKKNAVNSTK